MHSDIDAFAYIHTHFQCCIWYKVHSCAFKCILFSLHFRSLLYSRAFNPQDAFMCILGMLHSLRVAFQRILMHSQLDAFLNVLHSSFDASTYIILHSSAHMRMRYYAHECAWMRQNAQECTWLWDHTYLHKRSRARTQGQTWMDMGWTGCGRAIKRANVAPMCHYMPSKSSSDSSPSPSSSTVSSVGWMRVPATMLHTNACTSLGAEPAPWEVCTLPECVCE